MVVRGGGGSSSMGFVYYKVKVKLDYLIVSKISRITTNRMHIS